MNALQEREQSLSSLVGHVAAIICSTNFPTGDRAVLRRMNPIQPPPLAFYRFALRHLPDGWERRIDDWMTIVCGIAIMAPNAHRPDRGLGKALAEVGYAEARLERLLAAEGDTRRALLLRAARMLASRSKTFNWTEAVHLLITTDPDKLERLHRRIASDFYSNQHQD